MGKLSRFPRTRQFAAGAKSEVGVTMEYPFGEWRPDLGEALEIGAGVRWLRMPLPYALDHVNLWLLRDGDAWAAVDTGLATETIEAAWRDILATHRLSRLLVTHAHPDHLGLADWLQRETGAPLHISQGDYQWAHLVRAQVGPFHLEAMYDLFRRHGLGDDMLSALRQRGNAYARGVPALPPTFRRLRAGDEIAIGDDVWRVVGGCGHAPEHCSFHCAERGILVSGDMLLPRISSNVPVMAQMPDDDPLGDFLASLAALAELPAETLVLPSHGLPFRGIGERVAALQAHHRERCDAVRAACSEPRSVAELLPVVFERVFTDPHQCMFAMGEALAHVNYLEHRRQLRRLAGEERIRYVST